MLFMLRYKDSRAGVQNCLHEVLDLGADGPTQARAERSARRWCNDQPGRMFISTRPAVIFTCSNLDEQPATDDEPRRGPGRPKKEVAAPQPTA